MGLEGEVVGWTESVGCARNTGANSWRLLRWRVVMKIVNDQVAEDLGCEPDAMRKQWKAPVVEVHEVEDLTMAGPTNTNDGVGGSS